MDPEQAERMVSALETIASRLGQLVDSQHRSRIYLGELESNIANIAVSIERISKVPL